MSIIRSNIARQLLAEGGSPRKGYVTGGDIEDDVAQMEMDMGISGGPSPSEYSGMDNEEQQAIDQARFDAGFRTPDYISMGVSDDATDRGFFQRSIDALGTGLQNRRGQNIMNFLNRSTAQTLRGRLGLGRRGDINYVLEQLQANKGDPVAMGLTNKQFEIGQKLIDAGIKDEFDIRNMTQAQFDNLFPGPQTGEGGDNDPIRKIRAPITEKTDEEPKLSDIENLLRLRGSAFEDGGQVRQKFGLGGLGKVFKKAKNVVKKVAKSPIGKAALFAGLGAYGLGAGPFSSGKFGAGFLKSEGFKKFLLANPDKGFSLGNISALASIGVPTALSYLLAKKEENKDETLPEVNNTDPAFTNLINYYGGPTRFAANGGDIDEAPMKMASYGYNDAMSDTYDMFLQMKEKDLIPPEMKFDEFLQEVVPEMSKKQGIERAEAAKGGMMNPNDEMLDLGGNEMDLRGGGFVPLGEYEKKDDVPARLSKNEFVFTADAVRAAGGGSVDRGADLMYKTMKQLENKVV